MKKLTLLKSMLLLCALIAGNGNVWAQFVVEKVTATSGLVAGEKYIITCTSQDVAMGPISSSGSSANKCYTPIDISISGSILTCSPSSVAILTLGGTTDAWTLNTNLSGNYLSLTGYSNELKAAATVSANNTENWKISFSDGNVTIQNVSYPTGKSNNSTVRRIEYNKSSGSERFACYGSTQEAVQLYHITGYNASITSAAKYATFNSPCILDFSTTGITVYTAQDNTTSVGLTEVTSGKVPANTPVVLYKADADGTAINVPVAASADAIAGTNDLRVSTGTDVANMYVLAMNPTIGFYKWSGASDLSAGKVYLLGTSASRDFLGFEETTNISEIEKVRESGNETFFNLAGQRVAQPTKGMYIVNGKKVVIK